jgi:aspartate/methionine/tyrosine aminotransferase
MKTARRLDIIEEYYFSIERSTTIGFRRKTDYQYGNWKPRLVPSQSVIDAVKLALEDENAHQYQSYQGLPELRKSMADFYLNIMR